MKKNLNLTEMLVIIAFVVFAVVMILTAENPWARSATAVTTVPTVTNTVITNGRYYNTYIATTDGIVINYDGEVITNKGHNIKYGDPIYVTYKEYSDGSFEVTRAKYDVATAIYDALEEAFSDVFETTREGNYIRIHGYLEVEPTALPQ